MALIKNKDTDITQGSLFVRILLFSLPIMATGVLQLIFNATDLIVAGQLSGEGSLAAVGSCTSLINLIITLFLGLAVGGGVLAAQYIGAKNDEKLSRVIQTAATASFVLGVVVAIMGVTLARPLLVMMDTNPEVLDEAVMYMRAYFLGAPALMVYNYCASILRSAGDTKTPLIFLFVAGVANVFLNIIITLMLGEGKGALSVGIATGIASYISAIEIVVFMARKKGGLHLTLRRLGIDMSEFIRIIKIGLPAGLQGMLFAISNVLIQSTINGYGTSAVAGNTAAISIENFVYICMNALYHASLTFVGQNVGARRYDRVKRTCIYCSLIVVGVGLFTGALAFIFAEPLLVFYNAASGVALETGLRRMSIMCFTLFLCGFMEVGSGSMRAMGHSILPMIATLVGTCVLRIVWLYTVCPIRPDDIMLLYTSYPITWFLTATAQMIMTFVFIGRLNRQQRA